MPKFCDGKCTDLLPPNHAAQASNNFVLGNDRSHFLRDQKDAILALGKLPSTTKSTDAKFGLAGCTSVKRPCNGQPP